MSNTVTSFRIDSIQKYFTASVIKTSTEYEALTYRNTFGDDKVALDNALSKNYNLVDSSLQIKNATDKTKPLTYAFQIKNKTEVINNKIYILPFLNETYTENPLKQKTRTYPVDLTYPYKRTYLSEITIPEGYTVQFMPDKSSLNDDLFELDYAAVQNDNSINVSFTYTFKHAIYQPDEYARIKTMFDRIVKKGSEKIVLVTN